MSKTAATSPPPTSTYTTPGTCPACSSARDSAAYEMNSPCGTKITRVTENTSNSASASSA